MKFHEFSVVNNSTTSASTFLLRANLKLIKELKESMSNLRDIH